MTQAKSGDTVKIHYTGTLDDGTQFDSSAGRDPLQFTLGTGQVIPGFDKAVEGMTIGESKSINIPAEEAYGPHHEQMVQDVPRTALPEGIEPEVGMVLQARGQDGQLIDLNVTAVADESITVTDDVPVTLSSLSINGDSSVMENSSANYTAMATFSDGSTLEVTDSAHWTENSPYASINSAGMLSTSDVSGNTAVTIEASYEQGGITETATKEVTIVNVPEENSPPNPPVITYPGNGDDDIGVWVDPFCACRGQGSE